MTSINPARRSAVPRRRIAATGLVASLLLSCAPIALHAETNTDLAREIAELKAQIREMKGAIAETRTETRRTSAKVRSARAPAPSAGYAPAGYVIPPGAVPAFVTIDKKLQFGAITITPGGFLAAEGVFRSRTTQSDIGTQFNAVPFGPQAGTNEFRFSARQSRIAALLEAPITPTFLASAYGEFDFLGSGVTSNENESNSFVPRIRNLYAALDMGDYGFHVLAGQSWSLATLNSKGITPRNEVAPPQIDAQFIPGFVWKRQPGIRITKDFGKKLWISLSAEESQDTFSNCTQGVNGTAIPNGATGTTNAVTCQLPGNNNLNGNITSNSGVSTQVTNFSLNHVPDVVGKVAYEARFAERDVHLEAFGLYRDLYDRVAYNVGAANQSAANQDRTGYGVGGGLIAPILPRKLDFQVSGMVGRGIGTYGTTQFNDATFSPNGSISPIRAEFLLAGLTLHATPSIDLYAFGGVEQVQPDYFATNAAATAFSGYGAPTGNNSGCYNTIAGGTCNAQNKRIWQVTGGMWDKLYKGSFGEVRVGVQYSYTQRELFQGNGFSAPATAALPFAPKQNEQIVLTSFRYYPFQ